MEIKSFLVDAFGDCLDFLLGLTMILGAVIGWMFFEILHKMKAEDIKRGVSWSILIAMLSLGFVGVGYFILGFFSWESSLYSQRIVSKLFLGSIVQIIPLFAILFLSPKMTKANVLLGDIGGIVAALTVGFLVIALLGGVGLIVSIWWLITRGN